MLCRHPYRKGCCVQVAVRVGQVSRAPTPRPRFYVLVWNTCWSTASLGKGKLRLGRV